MTAADKKPASQARSKSTTKRSMRDILPSDFRPMIEGAKEGHLFLIDCNSQPAAAIIPIGVYRLLVALDEHPEIKAQLEALMNKGH